MKLNQDCVRDIMLFIEKNVTFGMFLHLNDFIESSDLKKYDSKTIKYTLGKLDETKFLHSNATWIDNNLVMFSTGMLTWDGHKFLDTIRDSKVWSTTKSVTEKLASVSMSMIESISAQVISNIIKSQMIKNGSER